MRKRTMAFTDDDHCADEQLQEERKEERGAVRN